MMYSFVNRFKLVALYMPGSKLINFMLGMISGLAFAPSFFIPGLIGLGALCYQTFYLPSAKQACIKGFIFGFGHFLSSMYWISIGVSVYINEFWWAIPFALFGLPLILACFIAASCFLSWFVRNSKYYHILFCLAWILFEWVRSWIFTGLPWNLLGYVFAFSNILIQISSIIGIYGLSFIVIYAATSFFYLLAKNNEQFKISLITSIFIISLTYIYGTIRLQNNPTFFSEIKVKLVQPSIPQIAKWDIEKVWENLDAHIHLSEAEGKADIIIWSEAALVIPYKYQVVKNKILNMLQNSNAILITGGIADNNKFDEEFEIYTSLQAISPAGNILFEYHKSHLVPFGEYMPLKNILPFKKLTPGFIDYTAGEGRNVHLRNFNLSIKPLICYETIFPSLVQTSNKNTDVIINVTNDTWYGKSSGPYQHFHISRLRAIENGLPMLRVANNGISAIIDPLGRVIEKLPLDKIGIIEGKIPLKIATPTFYSHFGNSGTLIVVLLVLILQPLITFIIKFYFILFRRLD